MSSVSLRNEGESSSLSGTILGKRPRERNRPFSNCDACKRRKVRCDGALPCTFCAEHKYECTYSQGDTFKRQRTESGAVVRVNVQPAQIEHSLLSANARQYYWGLFLQRISPMFRAFEDGMFAGRQCSAGDRCNASPAQRFVEGIALAHTARTLGHVDIAQQLYEQARRYAGELIDTFSVATIIGYALLMMYNIGQHSDKAVHYAAIANSLAANVGDDPRVRDVVAVIKITRLLEGPRRLSYADPQLSCKPKELHDAGLPVEVKFNAENVIDLIRSFPLYSPILDVLCRHKVLERYPAEQRSDEYPDLHRVETAVMRFQEYVETCEEPRLHARVPWNVRQHFLQLGCTIYLLSAARLVEAGRHYYRLVLAGLKALPLSQAGFSIDDVVIAVMAAANFAQMYHIHPHDEFLDYRIGLRELHEIMLPLAPVHPTCSAIVKCLTTMLDEPDSPPRFTAREDQHAVFARWLATYRLRHADEYLSQLPTEMIGVVATPTVSPGVSDGSDSGDVHSLLSQLLDTNACGIDMAALGALAAMNSS